ncbi:hypothetical protein [Caldivirga maquilingensis]|nr:hypothetical protein [Caldivirga maquilingensis]
MISRRGVLLGVGLALAGATAGGVYEYFRGFQALPQSSTTTTTALTTHPEIHTAGFGWEVVDLHNNGADAYFQALNDVIIHWIDLDASYMLIKPPSSEGFAEVLITVGKASTPSFSKPPQVYQTLPQSTSFTPITIVNPNNLQTVADAYPGEGFLVRLILKSWVPSNGTASSVQRHVTLYPGVRISNGEYLIFHMDHAGVGPLDCEIQATLGYSLIT